MDRIYVNVNLFYFKMYVSPHCLQLPMLSFLNVIYTSQGSTQPFSSRPDLSFPTSFQQEALRGDWDGDMGSSPSSLN